VPPFTGLPKRAGPKPCKKKKKGTLEKNIAKKRVGKRKALANSIRKKGKRRDVCVYDGRKKKNWQCGNEGGNGRKRP